MSIDLRNGFQNGGRYNLLNFLDSSFRCYSLWHCVGVGVAISGIGVGNRGDNLLGHYNWGVYNTWDLVGVGVAISSVAGVASIGTIVISVEDSRISFSLSLSLSLAKMMNSVSGISGIMSSISDGMVKSICVCVWDNLLWFHCLDGRYYWFHSLGNGYGGHC